MKMVGFSLLAAVAVAFTFYSCTASGPADVSGQSIPSLLFTWIFWLLPRKPQVTQPGVLDLHAAEEERARRTEGSDDSTEGSYTIRYSIYLYCWLDFINNIIKSNPPVHVSSFFPPSIYACYRNTIEATMDLPSPIKPRRVVEDTIPPVHVISFFPPTIYACYRNTIEATMDLPSPIKPRRVKRCIIVDDSIDLTPVRSKTVALMDAKYRMRLQRACRRQLFK